MQRLATNIVHMPWGKRGIDPRCGVAPDRQVGESENGTMWETTRVIASRRWRKIEFADMVASAEAS